MSDLLAKLGSEMLLSQSELMKLVSSAPRRYKVYQIPKRKPGAFRTIAQPAKEVKRLQYWVMKNVLSDFPVHVAATGYRPGKGLASNAWPHARNHFLLKLDFRDCFPSLRAEDFRILVGKGAPNYSELEVEALLRILFWKPKGARDLCLSIGAPSSPMLSNILLYDFDATVAGFCTKVGGVYTRYADDLSFSALQSRTLQEIEKMVVDVCARLKSPKMAINTAKTVRVSKKQSRRITGLVITNDARVSLGRDQKRRIRASVDYFTKGRLSPEECMRLKGMLGYVNSVEPEFVKRLRDRYGAHVIRAIQTVT